MKKWIAWLCSLLLLLPLAACSNGADQGKKPLKTVRLAEVTRSIFYAPQYVALAKGFFKEEGLDVELTTTWGGDKTMTTLLSGGADIALVGSETSIYVYAQGTDDPVINFAQLTQTDGTFLVSRKKSTTLRGRC
ncbi:NMT1/THI5 like protein [Geobacillus sp. BCO2]|nr:NMT1/THI5 like protein [Geobacillus sp. BCO2]